AITPGGGRWHTLGLAGVRLGLIGLFIAWESRARQPLMPFSIFRLRTLRGANVVGLLIGLALFAMFFFLSLYMQQVLGYDALKTGISYLPLALMIVASAGVASTLTTRIGFKPVLVTGMLMLTGGLVWFSQVDAGGSFLGDVLFPSIIVGFGLGLAFVSVMIASVMGTKPEEAGL